MALNPLLYSLLSNDYLTVYSQILLWHQETGLMDKQTFNVHVTKVGKKSGAMVEGEERRRNMRKKRRKERRNRRRKRK